MQNIGGFFQNFNNKLTRGITNLVFIIEIIKKHTGIEIEMKDIKISNGILRIKGSSMQKNVIFIKKERILKELEVNLQALKIRDIQ